MPSAALIEVVECPTPNVSYSLSERVGKRSESARLLDRVELLAAPRQNLVRIGLVAHVPNQPVVRRIEDVVQGYRQFDGAEPGGKVAATGAHTVDEKLPQLLGELGKFRGRQPAQVVRGIDGFEQRVLGTGHCGELYTEPRLAPIPLMGQAT